VTPYRYGSGGNGAPGYLIYSIQVPVPP
jgi:hypothetical protein